MSAIHDAAAYVAQAQADLDAALAVHGAALAESNLAVAAVVDVLARLEVADPADRPALNAELEAAQAAADEAWARVKAADPAPERAIFMAAVKAQYAARIAPVIERMKANADELAAGLLETCRQVADIRAKLGYPTSTSDVFQPGSALYELIVQNRIPPR